MNIETLMFICRGDELFNYDLNDYDLKSTNVDKKIAKNYELISEDIYASGSPGYLDDVGSEFIIKNKETGELYRIYTGHDSWTDSLIDSFRSPVIQKVKEVEVTVVEYEEIGKTFIEDL